MGWRSVQHDACGDGSWRIRACRLADQGMEAPRACTTATAARGPPGVVALDPRWCIKLLCNGRTIEGLNVSIDKYRSVKGTFITNKCVQKVSQENAKWITLYRFARCFNKTSTLFCNISTKKLHFSKHRYILILSLYKLWYLI